MADPQVTAKAVRRKWVITVKNYGSFMVIGTEANARRRAKDKGEWEGERWSVREADEKDEAMYSDDCADVDKVYCD